MPGPLAVVQRHLRDLAVEGDALDQLESDQLWGGELLVGKFVEGLGAEGL